MQHIIGSNSQKTTPFLYNTRPHIRKQKKAINLYGGLINGMVDVR